MNNKEILNEQIEIYSSNTIIEIHLKHPLEEDLTLEKGNKNVV